MIDCDEELHEGRKKEGKKASFGVYTQSKPPTLSNLID